MRIVALIPYWNNYKYESISIVDRDALSLSGKVLLNYSIELANKTNFINRVCLFTSDMHISKLLDERLSYEVIKRSNELDAQNVSIEKIIADFLKQVDADVIVLLHPKSPFLRKESLSQCIEAVVSKGFDSAFVAREERKFAWFDGKRVNYDYSAGTPHLSAIRPIILETSSAYVFTKLFFINSGTRISKNPFIKIVGNFEGLTISGAEDLALAQFLQDSQYSLEG